MNHLWTSTALLAQRTRVDELANKVGEGFREQRSPYTMQEVLLALGAVLALLFVSMIVARLISIIVRRVRQTPAWLFRQLCSAHQLSRRQRRLLWHVAACRKLSDPAELFVTPELLECGDLNPRLRLAAKVLAELRSQLFQELETDVRAQKPSADPPAAEQPSVEALVGEVSLPPTSIPTTIPAISVSGWTPDPSLTGR